MKSKIEHNKNSIGEVKDILNNEKMTEEHYIMDIYNIDNNDHLHVERENFFKISGFYWIITMKLEEFPDIKTVHEKQEYELRLDSQQIERIFLKNLKEFPDLYTVHEKQEMEELALKDVIIPMLNSLELPLEDEEEMLIAYCKDN